jgi:aryl-alcohol dehydrogenase-like predicted oxidoreductase
MKQRTFGDSGRVVSEVGLGTWQLGGSDWGGLDEDAARNVMHAALDAGINFFDTADVYGSGASERRIGAFLRQLTQDADPQRQQLGRELFVATKLGRGSTPGGAANFSYEVMRAHTERSLENLGRSCLDLTQTHCVPHAEMKSGGVFTHLQRLQREGLISRFGASVESVEEAFTCLKVEGLSSLQVIFNVFRQKPAELLFEEARARNVAIIVRLPLASGLLGGQLSRTTTFEANDHRTYNRDGQAFNVGETFAGLGFERGLSLTQAVQTYVPEGMSLVQFAMRFCLDFPAVTTVIPGATKPGQIQATASASELNPLPNACHAALRSFYVQSVHAAIRGSY